MTGFEPWRLVPRTATRPTASLRLSAVLGLIVALATPCFGALVLLDSWRDARRGAEQSSLEMAATLDRDIVRIVAVMDICIAGAAETWRLPDLPRLSPAARQAALFGRAAAIDYVGSIQIVDQAGRIVAGSTVTDPGTDLSDREAFTIHRDRTDAGLHISRPYRSRLRADDPIVALSRRIAGPDGSFEGVVVGSLRLAFIEARMAELDLGPGGEAVLYRDDGIVLASVPPRPGAMGQDVAASPAFTRMAGHASGQFQGPSPTDGAERLRTFSRVQGLPLLIEIGQAPRDVYAHWWRRAPVIGATLALLTAAIIALCLLFRRELWRRLRAEAALRASANELREIAATDSLTGLANRRAFEARLSKEWRRGARPESDLALLMIDADGFKSYNDRYGHPAGDEALRRLASCLEQAIRRPADYAARIGGEEFVVLLPETDATSAQAIAERIRACVAEMGIAHEASPAGILTVSIGIAAVRPGPGKDPAAMMKRADEALYEAKRAGRNRLVVR